MLAVILLFRCFNSFRKLLLQQISRKKIYSRLHFCCKVSPKLLLIVSRWHLIDRSTLSHSLTLSLVKIIRHSQISVKPPFHGALITQITPKRNHRRKKFSIFFSAQHQPVHRINLINILLFDHLACGLYNKIALPL